MDSDEAAWRILLHERYPPVMQLAAQLENSQRVYFIEETAMDQAIREPP